MSPPQVNLNDKPAPEVSDQDPLPEKKDKWEENGTTPAPFTINGRACNVRKVRMQRKRLRVACCVVLTLVIVTLLTLGTVALVFRFKYHRSSWTTFCGVNDQQVAQNVSVDPDNQLIYVRPLDNSPLVMSILHEYNRQLVAFLNRSANACYIDRITETFSDGYERWQSYEDKGHTPNRTLRVKPDPIEIDVIVHFGGEYIIGHCGNATYYWAIEVTVTEVMSYPKQQYIKV